MNRILYLEGSSGISGDMTVAALLDLGGSREKLDGVLKSMELDGFDYAVSRKTSYGIAGCDFDVTLHHEHHHGHEHHHEHRNLDDVYAIIDRGKMTERANALAKRIFLIVAEAEVKAHGVPLKEVHFHEVGAVDSIVDIVSVSVLIDDLGITDCAVCGLTEGYGTVRCQHGELPVPVPAVLNIAKEYGIPLRSGDSRGEMITPTGIAIAAALRTRGELPREYKVLQVGIGLGKRDFGHANILRAMVLSEAKNPEQIVILETNIDDQPGESLGFAMERLLSAGARDVHFVPCMMKKNRPGCLLRVIADAGLVPEMERVIFESTTTIGIRRITVERSCMSRESAELELPFGKVKVKKCGWEGIVRCYPEYESVKALAEKTGMEFSEVLRIARAEAEKNNR